MFAKKGQGATEYLVLLAVVLIIALVSIALLGFFPGMSEDAKLAQSQAYWKSAYPIAITEWGAKGTPDGSMTMPYFSFVNQGGNPIRITTIISGNNTVSLCGGGISQHNITNILGVISPGQAIVFGWSGFHPGITQTNCTILIKKEVGHGSALDPYTLFGASSLCGNDTSVTGGYGTLVVNDFGFEYVAIVDGQEITNRQIGKTLMIKCLQCYGC